MLALTLDLSRLRLALIGGGTAARRRLERLDAAGAAALTVYAPRPGRAFAAAAGARLVRRIPSAGDLAGIQVVFVAGLAAEAAARVAERARIAGAIVHVEDAPAISDAQMPAMLHRGDLAIAISTAGRAPALAAELKRAIGRILGPEWAARVAELGAARERWRTAGLAPDGVRRRTAARLAARAWLASGTRFEAHWGDGAAIQAGSRVPQHRTTI